MAAHEPPPAFSALAWKQGFSATGLSAALRWRRRRVDIADGRVRWSAPDAGAAGCGAGCHVEPRDSSLDFRLTDCAARLVPGSDTRIALRPAPGKRWHGVGATLGSREYIFDAVGSGASPDEWVAHLAKHIEYARGEAKQRALRDVLSGVVSPVAFTELRACAPRAEDIDAQCPICLDAFNDDQLIVRTICGHTFHDACARKWLLQQGSCPLCRTDLWVTLPLRQVILLRRTQYNFGLGSDADR